jgi:hypothetical protein
VRAQGRHNILFFDLLLNSLSHLDETFFDASGGLGRSLQEQQVVGISKLFSSLELDLSFSNKIALVTNQQFVNVLASVTVDLQQPLLNVVECLCICNIVDDNNAVSTTVVAAGNSSREGRLVFLLFAGPAGSPLRKLNFRVVIRAVYRLFT